MNNYPPVELSIGRPYHLTWAKSKGMVWILNSYDLEKNIANMETPKTGKKLTAKISDLYNINYYANRQNTNPVKPEDIR